MSKKIQNAVLTNFLSSLNKCFDETYTRYLVIFIIMLAFLFRIYGLGDHSIWIDEAGTATLVETFISEGSSSYPSGEPSDRSIPYIAITSFFVSVLGYNDFALRISSVIFGILTVFLVFKWSKELLGVKTAFFTSSLISFHPWHIAMSQNARMYSMFQFIYLLSFYSIYKYSDSRNKIYLGLTIVSASLALFTHITGYILLFTLPAYLIYKSGISVKKSIIPSAIISVFLYIQAKYLYLDVSNVFNKFIFSPNNLLSHVYWIFDNIVILSVLGITGLTIMFKENRRLLYLNTLAIFPPLIIYFYFVELPASRYIFFMIVFLAIASGYVLEYLTKTRDINSIEFLTLIVAILGVIYFSFGNSLSPELGSHAPQPDFKSIYTYLNTEASEEDILIAGRPLPADHYFKNPDYIILENSLYEPSAHQDNEEYSGSPYISNRSELKNIIKKNDSGWLVATKNVQRGVKPEFLNEINNLDLIKTEKNIRLWRWN